MGCGLEKICHTLEPGFIGRDRFIAEMMKRGYRVRKKKNYVRTTRPVKISHWPNCITGMLLWDINMVWQSDITYFLSSNRKFYYITFIIDVYSKRIIGYSVSENLLAESNINAVQMAIKTRKGDDLHWLIHHSDKGSQYVSKRYTGILSSTGAVISMGGKAQDNAYVERLNGTLKNEYLKYWDIDDLQSLKKAVKKQSIIIITKGYIIHWANAARWPSKNNC